MRDTRRVRVAIGAAALLACGGQASVEPTANPVISRLVRVHDYPMYLLDYQGTARGIPDGMPGRMGVPDALALPSAVAQANTIRSVVYDLSRGAATVAVGRDFSRLVPWSLAAPWPTGRTDQAGSGPGA